MVSVDLENMLVCRSILKDKLVQVFNQSSVLVEAAETSHIYYSGE